MSESLIAQAVRFDDEALEALASPGLVRRARRLENETTVLTRDDASVVVAVGEQRVAFRTELGIAKGTCSCPTVGPCQHVVAAIVAVARLAAEQAPGVEPTGDVSERSRTDVLDWLLSLQEHDLRRFAGRAAVRRAHARADIVDADGPAIALDGPIVIEFGSGITVRFMGPTFDSAFCDPASAQDAQNIVLAVLIVRSRNDAPIEPADEVVRAAPLRGPDQRPLLTAVLACCDDAVTIGIAHLSEALEERFDAVAIEARGCKLQRLSRICAAVAAQIGDLVHRRATANPVRLLADIALAHTLAELILDHLNRGAEVPSWLAGVARAEYMPVGSMELLAVGAFPWQTASGFVGVTGVFCEPSTGRFFEVGSGRAVTTRTDPRADQYREPIAWQGAPTLASLQGRRVHLTTAFVNAAGRISTSTRTIARTDAAWSGEDLRPFEWDGQEPRRRGRLHGDAVPFTAIVRVDESGSVGFDPVRQAFRWEIRAQGKDVDVVLPWSASSSSMIDVLESLAGPSVELVVGRLAHGRESLTLFPISLVVAGALRMLAFAAVDSPRVPAQGARGSGAAHSSSVELLAARVLLLAERGVDQRAAPLVTGMAQHAAEHGLGLLSRVLRAESDSLSVRVLRGAHIISEYRQLVGA